MHTKTHRYKHICTQTKKNKRDERERERGKERASKQQKKKINGIKHKYFEARMPMTNNQNDFIHIVSFHRHRNRIVINWILFGQMEFSYLNRFLANKP